MLVFKWISGLLCGFHISGLLGILCPEGRQWARLHKPDLATVLAAGAPRGSQEINVCEGPTGRIDELLLNLFARQKSF